jgi:2-dehydro-3-deoxyglucarate aldolase/4-hydroxy-2-oxoheptanedioate aldolase
MGASSTVPLIRVPWNDLVLIKKSLDIGPHGLIIPWINSKEEAIKAVKACKYPAEGFRGYGPRRPGYLDPEYVNTANKELLIIVQIETEMAVDNLADILSVEGLDGFYIGPQDLSASLGFLGNPSAPKVQDVIAEILDAGKEAGVFSGIHGLGFEDAVNRFKQGFQFVCVGSDLGLLTNTVKETVDKLSKMNLLS